MTKSQEKAIARIRRNAEEHAKAMTSDDLEFGIKEFETREIFGGTISVCITWNYKTESVLLRFVGREDAQVFIGKRGGITYPMNHKNGKYYTKKYNTLLGVIIDQRND